MIDRAHLEIIHAFKLYGSFAGAAQSLNVTQSALSHAISKLEKHLGIDLWERDGRGSRLTQAGEYLLKVSERILPQLEETEKRLQNFNCGESESIRISAESYLAYTWLLSVTGPYLQRWPNIDVDISQVQCDRELAALKNQQTDIVITSKPPQEITFSARPILSYELQLIVAQEHALAKCKWVLPQGLRMENLITFPAERDIFTHFLSPAASEPLRQYSVESIELMLQLVEAGRGVCALPDWVLRKYSENRGIKSLSLGRKGVHQNLFLVFRTSDKDKEYLLDFVNSNNPSKKAVTL